MSEDEKVFDKENWKLEATAVALDIKDHVKSIAISESLQSDNSRVYFNLTTLENQQFCIELSALGFRIVGTNWDSKDSVTEEYFETPYGLLNKISAEFKNSFGNLLFNKLKNLE